MAAQDSESIIDEFLGETTRAAQWRALRLSLSERLTGLRKTRQAEAELNSDRDSLKAMDTQIAALARQVAALETEEVVAEFVENSLHVTLARSALDAGGDLDE